MLALCLVIAVQLVVLVLVPVLIGERICGYRELVERIELLLLADVSQILVGHPRFLSRLGIECLR